MTTEELDLGFAGFIGAVSDHKYDITSEGIFVADGLILKMYQIKDWREIPIENCKKFILERVEEDEIEKLSRLGFIILDPETIDVCVWDNNFPKRLVRSLWMYDDKGGNIDNVEKANLNENSYGIQESEIMHHEAQAWRKYLFSKQKEDDKIAYLNNVLQKNEN